MLLMLHLNMLSANYNNRQVTRLSYERNLDGKGDENIEKISGRQVWN